MSEETTAKEKAILEWLELERRMGNDSDLVVHIPESCFKCGWGLTTMTWREAAHDEWFEVECCRCGYSWREEVGKV